VLPWVICCCTCLKSAGAAAKTRFRIWIGAFSNTWLSELTRHACESPSVSAPAAFVVDGGGKLLEAGHRRGRSRGRSCGGSRPGAKASQEPPWLLAGLLPHPDRSKEDGAAFDDTKIAGLRASLC